MTEFINVEIFVAVHRTIAKQAVAVTGDYKDASLL